MRNKPVRGCMLNVGVKEKLRVFWIEWFSRRIEYVSLYAWESVTKGFRVSVKKNRVPMKDKRVWVGGA